MFLRQNRWSTGFSTFKAAPSYVRLVCLTCFRINTCDSSGQSRDRTGDLRIFSPSLYQLSYLSKCFVPNTCVVFRHPSFRFSAPFVHPKTLPEFSKQPDQGIIAGQSPHARALARNPAKGVAFKATIGTPATIEGNPTGGASRVTRRTCGRKVVPNWPQSNLVLHLPHPCCRRTACGGGLEGVHGSSSYGVRHWIGRVVLGCLSHDISSPSEPRTAENGGGHPGEVSPTRQDVWVSSCREGFSLPALVYAPLCTFDEVHRAAANWWWYCGRPSTGEVTKLLARDRGVGKYTTRAFFFPLASLVGKTARSSSSST